VREALAATPKQVTLAGKIAARDLHLPRANLGFVMRTGTGAHGFIDPETRAYRNMDMTDVPTIAALASGPDQVGFIAHPFAYGVQERSSDIHGVVSLITRTDKHIWLQPCNIENDEYLMQIVQVSGGTTDRPIASTIMCSFTPLEFKVLHGLDPITHTYGTRSDTPDADRQSMVERTALDQAVAMAGGDIMGGVGQLETATVFCPVQAVLDDEMGGYLRALSRASDIDDAAFNWDEINQVGIGPHFLDSPHTLTECRSQYRPDLYQRDGRDDYDKNNRRGA